VVFAPPQSQPGAGTSPLFDFSTLGGDELREGQKRPEQDQAFPRRDRMFTMLMPILEDSS
jgi:hypothetical protein